jgi:ketosteroid isomerase-like protein
VRAENGAHVERIELLGTAGDRIVIQRMLWAGGRDGDGFEWEHLVVQEVDEAGRLAVHVNFDSDDARAAQREAWKLWERLDPAAVAVATPMGELADAFNARDRDRWRAQFADEIVVEDHRRTGFGRIEGADAYADSLVALWELAPETTAEVGWHWPALGRHGAITRVRRTGVLPDGGAFESDYLGLYTVSGGRITYFERFELEDLEAAMARFEALCSGGSE